MRDIHMADVDVFAPCALGAILNSESIPQIKAPIVAGGANNQLAVEARDGMMLQEKGILYAPDYVINAGGLINVFHELKGFNAEAARNQAAGIYDTLLQIYEESDRESILSYQASNRIAERRIEATRNAVALRHTYDNQVWLRR